MHDTHRIDDVQKNAPAKANVRVFEQVVIICVGICDTAAARWNVIGLARVDRFHEGRDRAGRAEVLRIRQPVGIISRHKSK